MTPPREPVDFGDLRRTTPVTRSFGFDRGQPVDRYYMERFLAAHAADVHGRVLEVGDGAYTRRFGAERVTGSDVLHAEPGNPAATFVGDLATGDTLPSDAFDCFICTQTLMYVYDVRAAVGTIRRILKPGGVLLATVPGISQISPWDMERWGEFWRFTRASAARLFGDEFGAEHVTVESHGNVLAAATFLYGLAAEDVTPEELDARDPEYELLVAVRAVKTGGWS